MIDQSRLLETFLSILRVNSYFPGEDAVVEVLGPIFERVGFELSADEHRNVLAWWPGSGVHANDEPILLCAHTDTVRPTAGMEPVVRGDAVHSDGSSVLGADDKAAVAAIVEAVEAITDEGIDHPPAELLFTVGEDVGHIGSKAFDVTPVRSRMAFVPDVDGPVGGVITAAPWTETVRVTFHGRSAHAGIDPEAGRSALQMAAAAVSAMPLGRVDEETTANVGTLSGGEAANIIPERAELLFQVRSLDERRFIACRDELTEHCRQSAGTFGGTIDVETVVATEGYRHDPAAPVLARAESAFHAAGLKPWRATTCGGSDANELNAKGLPTAVISVGYQDIHTTAESMPLGELGRLTEVCRALLLGSRAEEGDASR